MPKGIVRLDEEPMIFRAERVFNPIISLIEIGPLLAQETVQFLLVI